MRVTRETGGRPESFTSYYVPKRRIGVLELIMHQNSRQSLQTAWIFFMSVYYNLKALSVSSRGRLNNNNSNNNNNNNNNNNKVDSDEISTLCLCYPLQKYTSMCLFLMEYLPYAKTRLSCSKLGNVVVTEAAMKEAELMHYLLTTTWINVFFQKCPYIPEVLIT
ncbi:hypothetical protein DUI87_25663 [Hirundo rustica rustica]|uniref:Uncharacterized protein n=1 Tax=Hirundo rustica rustica TaxID=333673 RepID=A0A3M0JSG4_HIRRU|nr:hypothetical protein DUI87_25663 [Hirundo rustica rustica]